MPGIDKGECPDPEIGPRIPLAELRTIGLSAANQGDSGGLGFPAECYRTGRVRENYLERALLLAERFVQELDDHLLGLLACIERDRLSQSDKVDPGLGRFGFGGNGHLAGERQI